MKYFSKDSKLESDIVGKDMLHSGCVVYGNVEQLYESEVSGTCDLFLLGKIVEHLLNPSLMLQGLHKFAHKDSEVLLTCRN